MSTIKQYEYRAKDGELLGWYERNTENISFDPAPGWSIHKAVKSSFALSNQTLLPVKLVFNDINLDIKPYSNVEDMEKIKAIYFNEVKARYARKH